MLSRNDAVARTMRDRKLGFQPDSADGRVRACRQSPNGDLMTARMAVCQDRLEAYLPTLRTFSTA
jgi:hypothetical protein